MAAKVDDNAEPRRRIPDHPPYSLMIGKAIRSLNEEQGSTESSISEYIKANFDGLPWGHDRLLPYYLNKLVAQGEFVNGATNRYLLADDDEYCHAKEEKIATLPPMNVKGRGKFVRKKRPKVEVGTKPLQSVASTLMEPEIKVGNLDEDVGVPVPTLIEPEIKDGNLDKDKGAPLEIKDGNFDEDEGVPLACEGDLVIEVHPCKSDAFDENNKVAANNNGEMISMPMGMQSSVGESAIVSELIASSCDDFQPSETSSSPQKEPIVLAQSNSPKNSNFDALGSESVMHKSCGRLPKIKDAESMKLVDSSSLGNNDNVIEPENIEDRGATNMTQNQEDGSKQAPEKLGRPRKRKHQALEDSTKESIVHVGDVDTLHSVDPSSLSANDDNAIETQVTEDLGVTRMAQNQEDGSKQARKKLGRPRKGEHQALEDSSKEAIAHIEDVDALPLVNLSSSCTNEDTRNRDDESKSVSKRLGRPPKKKSEDIEMVQAANIDEMKNPTETQTNDVDGSESVSKKLGRPPKSKKSSSENGDQVDLLECDPKCNVELQEGKKESDPMPKHRGKPNKNKLGLVATNNESNLATDTSGKSEEKNSSWVHKYWGRPPKPKLDLKVDMP